MPSLSRGAFRFSPLAVATGAVALLFATALVWAALTADGPPAEGHFVEIPPSRTAETAEPTVETDPPADGERDEADATAAVPPAAPPAAETPESAASRAWRSERSQGDAIAEGPILLPGRGDAAVRPDADREPASLPESRRSERQLAVLQPAPLPGLAEETPMGLLPIIAPDGRQPWKVYARPFRHAGDRPRIAIVLVDLGLRRAATNVAIQMEGAITLAFAPYSRDLRDWIELARTAGHEVLLQLPMEPENYPTDDAGPQALLTSLTPAENIERLNWHLGRFPGYVGVIDYMGGRFSASPEHLEPVLRVLKNRGLLLFDSADSRRSRLSRVAGELGVVTVKNDLVIDDVASRRHIAAQLERLEAIARERGSAAAIGRLFPVTLELLESWIDSLDDKGITLAPVSAMVPSG